MCIRDRCVEDVTNIAEDALTLAKDLNETVKKVEGHLEPIMVETNILLQNANILAEDIQVKSEKLDPLFNTAEGLASVSYTHLSMKKLIKDNDNLFQLNRFYAIFSINKIKNNLIKLIFVKLFIYKYKENNNENK